MWTVVSLFQGSYSAKCNGNLILNEELVNNLNVNSCEPVSRFNSNISTWRQSCFNLARFRSRSSSIFATLTFSLSIFPFSLFFFYLFLVSQHFISYPPPQPLHTCSATEPALKPETLRCFLSPNTADPTLRHGGCGAAWRQSTMYSQKKNNQRSGFPAEVVYGA